MDAATVAAIRTLIETQRVLTLAVLVDGLPAAALLPYAVGGDGASLVVQASALARHTRGLIDEAIVGVVIHEPATPDRDALQIPRLTVQATVRVLDRASAAGEDAAARLVARFPGAAMTLGLPDFQIVALDLGRGRFVEGFGRAVNVGPETFRPTA